MADPHLQRYELLEEVGQGGMAVVYRGLDKSLNREVAVKILHAHLADEEESKQRFQREAQAVAKLRHDNILAIYDYSGSASDQSYIVTEFIHGTTLKEFLARHPISHPELAAMIVCEVCRALAHAHSLAIIHRDIKPENIMIRQDGRVKLMDFGIAQMVDLRKLTVTGQLLGSPAYMAPELVTGKPVDFRTDVFSVGTLLYQLATAQLPFTGRNPHEVLKRIAEGRYVPPEVVNPIVDAELGGIIRRALARDPRDRYAEIADLRADLDRFLAGVDISSSRDELAAYFDNPVQYSRDLQQRVVLALMGRGRAALQQRNIARALRCFDRVLCAEPANQEVTSILDRLSRRRRWRHALVAALAVSLVLVAAYIWFASRGYGRGGGGAPNRHGIGTGAPLTGKTQRDAVVDGDQGLGPRRAAATPDAAAAAPDRGASARRSHVSNTTGRMDGAPGRNTRNGVRRNPAGRNSQRRVEIVPTPKAMTIWINGKRLGAYGPDLRYVDLPPGSVKLTFRNDACCFERTLAVAGHVRPRRLTVKLPWKPGRVRVKVVPQVEADVAVGSVVARVGQTVEVPIPSYSDNGRAEVVVRVSAPGYATAEKTVTVRANSITTATIALEAAQ